MRPEIVGAALEKISKDPEITKAMFDILETQNMVDGGTSITLVQSNNSGFVKDLLASQNGEKP